LVAVRLDGSFIIEKTALLIIWFEYLSLQIIMHLNLSFDVHRHSLLLCTQHTFGGGAFRRIFFS